MDNDFLIRATTTYSAEYGGPLINPLTTYRACYHIDCFIDSNKNNIEEGEKNEVKKIKN